MPTGWPRSRFGRDKWLFGKSNSALDAIIGGWQLTGIVRLHSGLPILNGQGAPFEQGTWATNWQLSSSVVRIRDVKSDNVANVADPTAQNPGLRPNIFADPTAAYRSFRSPRAGEVGDRNILRLPRYFVMDAGLGKTFKMPYAERHSLQFRWEVFNLTNTQPFGSDLRDGRSPGPVHRSARGLTSAATSTRRSQWAKPVRGA